MSDYTIAIIADIHGNSWALEAALHDIQRRGIHQIVNLGDSLRGPLDPTRTADILLTLNIPTILGNDDRVLLPPHEDLSVSQVYTLERLTALHMNWLQNLPATTVVADELFLCHGDPSSDEKYLLEEVTPAGVFLRSTQAITAAIAGIVQPIILCAHSHVARTVFLPQGKLIINPGSVGMPAYTQDVPFPHAMEAGSPHARYALLSKKGEAWQVEHVLVPYDWEKAASVAQSNQRPDWAAWIATGRA